MLSDEHLTAWLDGELPQHEADLLQRRLAGDPGLAARIEALRLERARLVAAFAALEAGAPPFPQMESPPAPPPARRARLARSVAVAALVVLVALAIGTGYWLGSRPRIGDWRTEVAHYQVLYVPDTLTGLQPDPARLAREFSLASARIGRRLDPDALSRIDGLTLRRAQVLGFRGQALIQIAYTAPDGTPIAFCIMRNTGGRRSPPKNARLMGLASESWQDAGHAYLVIGGNDPGSIAGIARQIRRQVGS